MGIAQSLQDIQEKIVRAAVRAKRDPTRIRIVAASKTVSPERIIEAYDAGIDTFGESYAQEFRDKHITLDSILGPKLKWHFIGRIQRNKVKYIVGKVELIHSLDNIKVADEINRRAEMLGISVRALIEVNAGEESKGGVNFRNVKGFLESLGMFHNIEIEGLMIMAPYFDEPEMARPYFRKLSELRGGLKEDFPKLNQLSMGMSADFEVAIEEGATIVRIGTAIFGPRPQPTKNPYNKPLFREP
jgi:pyridoxal phosphate enzyme (YggS family)